MPPGAPRKSVPPERRRTVAPPPPEAQDDLPDARAASADSATKKPADRRRAASATPVVVDQEIRTSAPRSRSSLAWLAGSPARDRGHIAHRSVPAPEAKSDAPQRTPTLREHVPAPPSARARTGPSVEPRARDASIPPSESSCGRSRRPPPPSRRDDPSHLEQAIGARQIEVVFQPVVDLKSGSIFAYEALARSKSPYFVDPTVLFTEAVRADRCGELGRLLRGLAIEGCPDAPLFLNVHPSELNDRYLVRPDDPLYAHPHSVFLEITESVPISHYEFCHTVLREIRSRGVFLVVDDLGAGYSNLMYIVDLYPEVVKLDRKLVTGLHQKPRQQMLVRHIVELCDGLGARVVAEGIETLDELHAVRDQGVRYAQGFLLARPSSPPPPVALTRREIG